MSGEQLLPREDVRSEHFKVMLSASQLLNAVQSSDGAPGKKTMRRRVFLKGAAATAFAAGLGTFNPPKTSEVRKSGMPQEPKKDASHVETISESALLTLSTMIGTYMVGKMQKSLSMVDKNAPVTEGLGNAGGKMWTKEWLENPKTVAAFIVVVGPVIEEAIARYFPSTLIDITLGKGAGVMWEIGVPLNILFTDWHNVGAGKDKSHADSISLPQFVMGLFYWYVMRERGFSHALSAHMFSNATVLAIATGAKQFASKEELEKLRRGES